MLVWLARICPRHQHYDSYDNKLVRHFCTASATFSYESSNIALVDMRRLSYVAANVSQSYRRCSLPLS